MEATQENPIFYVGCCIKNSLPSGYCLDHSCWKEHLCSSDFDAIRQWVHRSARLALDGPVQTFFYWAYYPRNDRIFDEITQAMNEICHGLEDLFQRRGFRFFRPRQGKPVCDVDGAENRRYVVLEILRH